MINKGDKKYYYKRQNTKTKNTKNTSTYCTSMRQDTLRRVRLGLKETAQRQSMVQIRQSWSSGAGLSVVMRISWQYSSSRSSGRWIQWLISPRTIDEPRNSPSRVYRWTSCKSNHHHHHFSCHKWNTCTQWLKNEQLARLPGSQSTYGSLN